MQFRSKAGLFLLVFALGFVGPSAGLAGPIYFSNTETYGVDPGALEPFDSTSSLQQVSASNSEFDGEFTIEFTQTLRQIVSRPDDPSSTDPYIADVEFAIRNTTGVVLKDAVLAFTRVIPNWPDDQDSFPADGVGFEEGDVDFLLFTESSYLPSLQLGDLGDDPVVHVLRMYVQSSMPTNSNGGFSLPPVGVAGFKAVATSEPALVLLMGAVLAGVVAFRRTAG